MAASKSKSTKSKVPSQSYEVLSRELDAVLVNLQRDDLDVDTALQDYQRGLELVKELEDYLKKAETKIQQIKAQS